MEIKPVIEKANCLFIGGELFNAAIIITIYVLESIQVGSCPRMSLQKIK